MTYEQLAAELLKRDCPTIARALVTAREPEGSAVARAERDAKAEAEALYEAALMMTHMEVEARQAAGERWVDFDPLFRDSLIFKITQKIAELRSENRPRML